MLNQSESFLKIINIIGLSKIDMVYIENCEYLYNKVCSECSLKFQFLDTKMTVDGIAFWKSLEWIPQLDPTLTYIP